jgi:uncharacterized membrane protein
MLFNFDEFFWLWLIYITLSPLVGVGIALLAFRRGTHLRLEVSALNGRVSALKGDLEKAWHARPANDENIGSEAQQDAERPLQAEDTSREAPASVQPQPQAPLAPPPRRPDEDRRRQTPPAGGRSAREPRHSGGWERRLASHWLLWLGGIALALGAAFLVKVMIDVGLMTPGLRCALGALLGFGLTVGGEVLRRRPRQIAIARTGGNHLPPAVSAAGLAALFASIYAAYGLYALIPAGWAFPLLGLTAFAAVGLSLLQGPFLAGLGLLGGFVTPVLVQSTTPAALPLFAFLTALTLAALAVARYRDWTWLAGSALSGATAWALLWTAGLWQPGDGLVFGLYLLILAGAGVGFRYGLLHPLSKAERSNLPWAARLAQPRRAFGLRQLFQGHDLMISGAALGVLFNGFFLLRLDHYSTWSLVVLGLLAVFYGLSGRRVAALAALPWLAATTVLASLALWHLPHIIEYMPPLYIINGQPVPNPRQPIVPPELLPFTLVSVCYGLLFAGLGYLFAWGARRPGIWASLSAGLPLAILIVAYWRIADFQVSLSWAGLAFLIGGLALWAAAKCRSAGEVMKGALAAYAVAVVAAVALAAATELREAWLTVALSLMLPAIAWIDGQLKLPALRLTAFAIAILVIARLLLHQVLLGGAPLAHPLFNWLLYGYGLPCLAFGLASTMFRRRGDDALVALLEAGALFFLTLLLTFEIRGLFNGGNLTARSYALAEQATLVLTWLGLALSLLTIHRRHPRPVLGYGWKLLGGWGLLHLALGPVILANPLFTGAAVGELPLFNLLGLAYLAPAALLVLLALLARRQGETPAGRIAASAVLVLLFVDLSLEVRHAFHGSRLALGPTTTAEWYAYSLAWLLFAGCLLGLGLRFAKSALRHAGLALLALAVIKVFLFDMAALTGLYRALSFMGLGAGLLLVGYLYQRFGLTTKEKTQPASPAVR